MQLEPPPSPSADGWRGLLAVEGRRAGDGATTVDERAHACVMCSPRFLCDVLHSCGSMCCVASFWLSPKQFADDKSAQSVKFIGAKMLWVWLCSKPDVAEHCQLWWCARPASRGPSRLAGGQRSGYKLAERLASPPLLLLLQLLARLGWAHTQGLQISLKH